MSEDRMVQLNYVIPIHLEDLLTRYCKQNLVSPSALIRRLILEVVEGDCDISPGEHPVGRRTTAALSQRLLQAFESKLDNSGPVTKAAAIAALLSDFLPPRVYAGETINVSLDLPVEVFNKLYDVYGPGPVDAVMGKALAAQAASKEMIKEIIT